MSDKKNDKKLLVLNSLSENGKIELSEDENELKNKLIEIENKIDSVEKALTVLSTEHKNSVFADDVFSTVVGAIAINAAASIIAEYFGVDKEEVKDLF